jgi:hypothetical protein
MYMYRLVTNHGVHKSSTSSWAIVCFPVSVSKITIISSRIGVSGAFLSTMSVLSNKVCTGGQVR